MGAFVVYGEGSFYVLDAGYTVSRLSSSSLETKFALMAYLISHIYRYMRNLSRSSR